MYGNVYVVCDIHVDCGTLKSEYWSHVKIWWSQTLIAMDTYPSRLSQKTKDEPISFCFWILTGPALSPQILTVGLADSLFVMIGPPCTMQNSKHRHCSSWSPPHVMGSAGGFIIDWACKEFEKEKNSRGNGIYRILGLIIALHTPHIKIMHASRG